MITKTHPSQVKYWMGNAVTMTSSLYTLPTNGCPSATYAPKALTTPVTVPGDTIQYENSDKRKFNYCLHTKDDFNAFPRGYWRSWPWSGGDTGYKWLYGCPVVPVRPATPAIAVVTDNMRRRAWQDLLPKLETGFSLANFIWELKDIPLLLKTARNLAYYVSKILTKEMRSSTKTASELMLAWSFAIAPFMRDVESIADLFSKTDKAVNKFIADGRKAQAFHYTEDLGETSSTTVMYTYFYQTVSTRAKYYATLRCKYEYQKPSSWEGLMRLWGLRITPEALWNAIPFSFIVDWVLKVGDALEQFDRDVNLKVEVLDYCDTTKSWSTTTVGTVYGPSGCDVSYLRRTCGGDGPLVQWQWDRTRYERVPCLPDTGYAFPVLDALSKRELLLSAALLRT